MSIRYTLRHNIPSDKLAEEDVNDSSTWDLNLLRKHELAETDNHDIVYRKHDGEVVNWAEAATQQANEILEEVQGISADIDNQVVVVENRLAEIEEEAITLTEEAQEANEAAQTALVQAELAVTESEASADSASWSSTRASEWASKTDGLVGDEDYSSKYYAQQAGASASSASSSASTATSAKNNAQTSATNASNSATLAQQWATKTDGKVDSTDYSAKHYALSCVDSATSASQSATSAATSASTATTKASQASTSASTATTKASEASASATSASNSATTATTKASEASTSASSASQSATSASTSATNASASATTATTMAASATASATSADASATAAQDILDEIEARKDYYGLPVGYEYFTTNPNIPQGSLPLFGGEYSRETYADLWTWVQAQSGYLKTEIEWMELSVSNNGNVPFYSDGDGLTTFRVPSLKCWIKGANGTVTEVGSYLEAGLPNITGKIRPLSWGTNSALSGAFSEDSKNIDRGVSTGTQIGTQTIDFNASRSSSIYGNSTTVQPESIVGMWLVKAYGTVVDTGQIDEQQYIDDRIATRLPLLGGTMNGNIAWTKGEIGYRTNTHTDPLVSCRQIIVTAGKVDSEWNDGNAKLALHTFDSTGVNTSENGSFVLQASDGTNAPFLEGSPNGNLKWAGKNIYTANIQPLTLQYLSNAIFAQSEFERCTAAYTRGFLVVCINMNSVSGKTTSDIITIGKIKNVNMEFLDYDIETIVDQGGRTWLLCLYDNGNDVDILVYCTSTTGSSRLGHVFTVPAYLY